MSAVFSQLENTLSFLETSITSACLVTAQKPVSPNPSAPVGWAFHQTGADRLSSANSSAGTRCTYSSGSVRSISGSPTAASQAVQVRAFAGGVPGQLPASHQNLQVGGSLAGGEDLVDQIQVGERPPCPRPHDGVRDLVDGGRARSH